MTNTLYWIDAFASGPFTGNPAAVCLLSEAAPPTWMQCLAAELNLSETAFLYPVAPDRFALRWFTPTVEVDLCGHATLASAHAVWDAGLSHNQEIRFETRSGVLAARQTPQGIQIELPMDRPSALSNPPDLSSVLGAVPIAYQLCRLGTLVELANADTVRTLQPDMARLAQLAHPVIVTAASDLSQYDFVSRVFAPQIGIPEDPVTGAAHCSLAPYWMTKLSKNQLRAYQASQRGGEIALTLQDQTVSLIGKVHTLFKGSYYA